MVMTSAGKQNQKKVFRRGTGGTVRISYKEKKNSKHVSALSGNVVHGVPHRQNKAGVAKLSKSQKRPSVLLGGKLDVRTRDLVAEEAIKVKIGIKELSSVELRLQPYVKEALNKVE